MDELIRRLGRTPSLAAEVVLATACINVLALADTLYVMIVLRRYIAHGFDGTLFILTAGVLAALALQWALSRARGVLADEIGRAPDEELGREIHEALVLADAGALDAAQAGSPRAVVADHQEIQSAYDAVNLCALADAPFVVLFVAATLFLHPLLALLVLAGVGLSLVSGLASVRVAGRGAAELSALAETHRGHVRAASRAADTMRAFRGGETGGRAWADRVARLVGLRRSLEDARGLSQSLSMGVGVLMRVAVYAVGAKLVVEGRLTVAALIGAGYLATYALQRTEAFTRALALLTRAREARGRLDGLLALPREAGGEAPKDFSGGVALKDVGFAFADAPPLLGGLTLDLAPGETLVVQGRNGAGKTTFVRLLAGLLRPTSGVIAAGGADLRALDRGWWRSQLLYMPQEPFFLAGTIRENLTLARPGIDAGELRDILEACGLREFLDLSEKGLETPLADAGRGLPVGLRKRLALARALASGGRLALLDEPTEGLDAEGRACVYRAMNAMARDGRGIVVVSRDPGIVKGATRILDLSAKGGAVLRKGAGEGAA
ncbi:ATP-binding cassette domain-containing protein [Desulfocurvus sp. DL9XJH121]